MAFLFVLKYVLSTCKTLFLESCTASTTMFSLLIPYLAPFFGIFHPGHQITGGNITYIHSTHTSHAGRDATRDRCHDESAISTYTPHAERDPVYDRAITAEMISTHTPHAGRDGVTTGLTACAMISTHTPLARRDFNGKRNRRI